MALPLFCSLLAAAFAGALIAYVPTARQHNWPVGILFERGTVPTAVYLGVAALLLGETIGWAWAGKTSWWGLLWIVLATFVGAPPDYLAVQKLERRAIAGGDPNPGNGRGASVALRH